MKRGAPVFLLGLSVSLADQTAHAPTTDRRQLWRVPDFPAPVLKDWRVCVAHTNLQLVQNLLSPSKNTVRG